jgi:hypothetical protein
MYVLATSKEGTKCFCYIIILEDHTSPRFFLAEEIINLELI